MYVEIGTEAAQFPEKECINGIAVAVYMILRSLAKKNDKFMSSNFSLQF